MPRELMEIIEDIDRRVRELLPADGEVLSADGEVLSADDWRYAGIAEDVISLLLEYRRDHAPRDHFEGKLHEGLRRIHALWPRCLRCQQAMSWRDNVRQLSAPDLYHRPLCRACKEAGFRFANWGACPICHLIDGCKSIGAHHWYFCDTHRVKWHIGSNLFSKWRTSTEEEWLQNAAHLTAYREVEPSRWKSHEQVLRETGSNLSELEPDIPF